MNFRLVEIMVKSNLTVSLLSDMIASSTALPSEYFTKPRSICDRLMIKRFICMQMF